MFSDDDDQMNESRARRRIAVEVLPSAIDHLQKIITAPGTKDADRISAIKVAFTHTLGPAAAGKLAKAPEDMTAEELAVRIAELRARQVARANGAKLIEGAAIAAPPPVTGIFD
ncbi:hypothetical protein [Paracoccus yeei]|jgi:hypothetical protein|uniref:hypothetical protein n=1 Tax=Paracoccus yeei TaxID=147645 RepID=UPI003BF7F4CE